MGQSRSNIVSRLTSAQQDRVPVTVRRKGLDDDETSGFVAAVLHDWVALHDLSEHAYLDAAVLLRLDYITKVETHSNHTYVSRVVAGCEEPFMEFEASIDATVDDLLRIIDERVELVGVHLENHEDCWYNVGKIRRIGSKRLDLHYIGRDGVWAKFVERWKLKDITRIEFGGRYIRALELFGEPMPAVTKRVRR